MRRRDFLRYASGAAATGLLGGWPDLASAGRRRQCAEPAGESGVAHVLPTVSHDRMLLKVSFREPQETPPWLHVDWRRVPGIPTDTRGRYWAFDVERLEPGRRYTLELLADGCPVMDPWELATFPSPGARPERFRVLVYTCAGGDDFLRIYVPMESRRALLRRALDFEPDAALVIGDHVYWDREAGGLSFLVGLARQVLGFGDGFDPSAPVLGNATNEEYLTFIGDRQIGELYGTLFRSLPTFFTLDDHDYFEDDREELFKFPADAFMRELARSIQWLYYPELLARAGQPQLPGSAAPDRPRRVGEAFGALRYGRLAELLIYDCKGYVSTGPEGGLVPDAVEAWLHRRMGTSSATHVVNVPSNPVGWTAGKPAEWYPDAVVRGELTLDVAKNGWQPGWLAQHDRLLRAASERPGLPLFLSGDIHSIAEARILRSGDVDLSANPIVSLISGTPGTGPRGFPSQVRQTVALAPLSMQAEDVVPVEEHNGFHLVDFEPDRVTIHHFRWIPPPGFDPVDVPTLEPFHVSSYPL